MLKGGHLTIVTRFLTILLVIASTLPSDTNAQPLPTDSSPLTPQYHGETKQKVARKIMRAEAGRTSSLTGRYGTDSGIAQEFSLPPLPGDQGFMDANDDPERFLGENSAIPSFGANNAKNVNIVLPPLKGLEQILNSPKTKEYLKRLTASESAVLMQTYMMVENGAATGFMGSVNIGSNLMSNLLETQDYQLKLLEASDDTGKMKKAYVARVAYEMQSGNNPDVWPAALYIASGEDGQAGQPIQDLSRGQNPYDLSALTGGQPGTNNRPRLTELLFVKSQSSSGGEQYKNDQIEELKKDFAELVGDIEITMNPQGNTKLVRMTDLNFIAPKADAQGRRGVAAVNWEEVQVVWENLHIILSEYCTWKQSDVNAGKEVFEMETETTTKMIGVDKGQGNPWELASAPDIPMTINVIQMLYKMYEQTTRASDINCSALRLTASGIPDDETKNQDPKNLNDCSAGKGCLRNRVALQLSYLIGRSRTLHTYRSLFTIAGRFVTDQFTADLLARVSLRAFAGMNLDEELRANFGRYTNFIQYMGQFAQGNTGAGSLLRPGVNEAIQPGKS